MKSAARDSNLDLIVSVLRPAPAARRADKSDEQKPPAKPARVSLDRPWLDELFAKYRRRMVSVAARIAGRACAEDVTQRAQAAVSSAPGVEPTFAVAYLFKVLQHEALKERRATQRRRETPLADILEPAASAEDNH